MVISLSPSSYSHSALGEWTPVITGKYNRKNIWRSIFHLLVRVLRKEIVWGQYVSTFSRWSLWVIDFVFIGICVEVVSCRAPVILLRSDARGKRRQHSKSVMPSVDPSLLCENKAIFLCKKLMVKHETLLWKLTAGVCFEGKQNVWILVWNSGCCEHGIKYLGSLKLEFLGKMRYC
jgi:hypothetical protein